ncbi:MAG: hypothetical protein ACOZAL_02595 [Patescibacteria group bacterium]
MKITNQKSAALLLTLLVMAALLSMAIGIARLSLGEIKLVRDLPASLIAYYAAETGVERALFEEWQQTGAQSRAECSVSLTNGSYYGVGVSRTGDSVNLKSIGCYKNTKRSIEVSF